MSGVGGQAHLGSVHKINGLTGSLIIVHNVEPFGRGRVGRSRVYVGKDRPGALRRHGVPGGEVGKTLLGDLVVDATEDGPVDLRFEPPGSATASQQAEVMDKIVDVLLDAPGGEVCSENQLIKAVRERLPTGDQTVRDGVNDLVKSDRVGIRVGKRNAKVYFLRDDPATDP